MNETASWLECPVCEYRFSVPPEYLDKSGKCPKCEKVFHAADCQLPEKAPGNDPAEPEIPEPMAFEGLETETGETAAPSPPPPPVPPGKATGQTEESEKEIDYNQSYVTADKKRTDPNRVLLLVAGSCALAIALLIGIPMIANMVLSRKPSPETANAGVNANSPQPNGQKTTGQSREASNRPGGQPPAQKTGGAKKRKKKAKKSQLAPFTVAELENLWKNCHSSIVLVNAKKGDQSTTSHGVVVSTDGKIAVSLSQVQGAESVRVRFADALYGGEKRWGKSAFATNILNTNPSLNLAIIQVPRKTVPATARSKPIGQNERGVVPVLVNKNADDYLRMTRLSPPQPYSSLAESSRTSLVSMDMEPQKNDYFTVHSARVNKNGVGVPVFDEQAKLVGVHVSHDEDAKSSFLVPYAPISKLVNDPTARATEFAVQKGENQPAGKPDSGGGNKKENAAITAPPAEVSEGTFDGALGAMDALEWKITDRGSYACAQQVARSWWNANGEYADADFTRRIEIEKLQERVAKALDQFHFWPNKDNLAKVNQMAMDAFVAKQDGWYGCVQVLKPSGIAQDVNNEPAILVELLETGQKALLVPGDVEGPFLQGSEWMVFGLNREKTRLKSSDGLCIVIHLAGVKKR